MFDIKRNLSLEKYLLETDIEKIKEFANRKYTYEFCIFDIGFIKDVKTREEQYKDCIDMTVDIFLYNQIVKYICYAIMDNLMLCFGSSSEEYLWSILKKIRGGKLNILL